MNALAGEKAIESDLQEDKGTCRDGRSWMARVREMGKIETVKKRGDGGLNLTLVR